MCCAFGCALTFSRRRFQHTRVQLAEHGNEISWLFRDFHDHTRGVPNSMEAIFPRGFYVHVRLLHFLRFFLFHIRKPLPFGAYNLIVAISNQFLFSLKTDEYCINDKLAYCQLIKINQFSQSYHKPQYLYQYLNDTNWSWSFSGRPCVAIHEFL